MTTHDPEAAYEADLGAVTDDEYFAALDLMPPLVDDDGAEVDAWEGVRDDRHPG